MPKRFIGSVPRPTPKRFRVCVPETDESVLAWIGAQSDLSNSVRTLIRESIERNGYRDATCYPVQQQARRGRPPKPAEADESQSEADDTIVGTFDAGHGPALIASTREGIGVNRLTDDGTKPEMSIADPEDMLGSLR